MTIFDFEDEYYLLYPSDIYTYPLIYEDCKGYTPEKENWSSLR
jgi:hypothetical protein